LPEEGPRKGSSWSATFDPAGLIVCVSYWQPTVPEIEAHARSIGAEIFLNKPVQLDYVAGIVRRLAGPSTGGGAPSSDW